MNSTEETRRHVGIASEAPRPERSGRGALAKASRYLTINTVIRKYTIETNRTDHLLNDETERHDDETVIAFSDAVRRGFPEARITWALSWQALNDQSKRYRDIRGILGKIHHQYGDDVTFVPGTYFANVYNSREQVNQDITEALEAIERFIPGYRPASILSAYLSAENMRYASEKLGIHTIQGNSWSCFNIDYQDGEGSIAYPYYPSTQHFCKPAQGAEDFIDCINLDGWTVDLVAARMFKGYWIDKVRFDSRMGVGPLETLEDNGIELGLSEMKATTCAHYCQENVARNPFGWITNNYEICEVSRCRKMGALDAFGDWVRWIKQTWPDVECPTMAELGMKIRQHYRNNDNLSYILTQKGTGIGASFAHQEVTWFMNKYFRLGIVKENGPSQLFDYTDYTKDYREPQEVGQRNWSLFGEINQKQTRPQDKPVLLKSSRLWPQLRQRIPQIYRHVPDIETVLQSVEA